MCSLVACGKTEKLKLTVAQQEEIEKRNDRIRERNNCINLLVRAGEGIVKTAEYCNAHFPELPRDIKK